MLSISFVLTILAMADIALEVGCCLLHSGGCGEERPAVALLPALRMPQSSAKGAVQSLHSGVQGVRAVTPNNGSPQPFLFR